MKVTPGVTYHQFEEKIYVHSVNDQKDYIFEGIAFDVLDFFAKNNDATFDDLCEKLSREYDVEDMEEFRNDMHEFVTELLEEKILDDGSNSDDEWSNKIPMEVASYFSKEHKLFSMSIELTYRCVERCIHCYIDDAPKFCAADELTLEEYKDILRQAREMGCVNVLFTGGEVLLRPDLCDIVEYATSLGFIVNVYTTGVGLTDKVFDRLCAAKVNGISVSLYSGIAEEHDKITGVKGSFEKTLKAALMFKSAGVGTFIKCVAMKQNIDSLESLYELGKRLGLYVTVSSRVISGHESKKSEDYSFGNVELYRKFFKMNSRYISVDKTAKKFSREEMLNRAACGAGINAMSIDPFGGVHACNTFHKPAGNLRQESLNDIWNRMGSLNLPNRRMRDVTPKCADCECLEYCTVCVADLLNKNRGNVIGDCGENILQAQAAAEILC